MSEAPSAQARVPDPSTRWRGLVMAGVAVLTPFIAYLSSLNFAALVALGGLLCLPRLGRDRAPLVGLGYLTVLALFAVASMEWSIATPRLLRSDLSIEDLTGLKMLLELALYGSFVAAAIGLARADARRASLILAIGLAALSLLFLAEAISGARLYLWIRAQVGQPTPEVGGLRDVGRVAFVVTLLFWPAAVRLEDNRLRYLAAAVALAVAVGAFLLRVDAPLAALVLSTAAFFAVRRWGRPALWAALGLTAAYFAFAPLVMHLLVPADFSRSFAEDPARLSWAARLDIWGFAAARIVERPLFGWGLDASRMFSPEILLHTHNAALQIWLELGAVGVILAALFWTWLIGRIDRLEAVDRTMGAAAAAAACAYLVVGALSFGVWQEWWIALGALAAAACLLGRAARKPLDGAPPAP